MSNLSLDKKFTSAQIFIDNSSWPWTIIVVASDSLLRIAPMAMQGGGCKFDSLLQLRTTSIVHDTTLDPRRIPMPTHSSPRSRFRTRRICSLATAFFWVMLMPLGVSAQYVSTNLVSNATGALLQDPNLVNGWGLAAFPTSPFWVSDQNTSTATLYTGNGTKVPLVVQIPCISSGTPTVPCPVPGLFPIAPPFGPSGIVANIFASSGAFTVSEGGTSGPAFFIFDTLDGLIVGWNPQVNLTQGVVAANRSSAGAFYTGLAIWGPASGPHLYGANAAGGIDVFDSTFTLVNTFAADANPSPFTPYGIQTIGNNLYVTYANPVVPGGIVDVCDLGSSATAPSCRRLTASFKKPFFLNGPWGLALAPDNFGVLSNRLLVGNLASGRITAFNTRTGHFQGTLRLTHGKPFTVVGLWALQFGGGDPANGATNHLFFTAGPAAPGMPIFSNGLFGVIEPARSEPNPEDGEK